MGFLRQIARKTTKNVKARRARKRLGPTTPGDLTSRMNTEGRREKRADTMRRAQGWASTAKSQIKGRKADKAHEAARKERLGDTPKPAKTSLAKKVVSKTETALINRQHRRKAAGRPNVKPVSKSAVRGNSDRSSKARAKTKDRIKNARGKVVSRVKTARRRSK